ncbi:hypothetical protein Tco_0804672 [Tanacetum coccineum]|uniref:Uncharacterized protein n=1 Tax=Tanacetum coccineum TaxID=301880 RepID=A0ABQ5A4Y1_9ASTR
MVGGQFAWNQNGYNAVQNTGHQVAQNEVQNPGILNVGKQNGLIVVSGIANQNGNGNQASTSGTRADKAPVYDSDGSTEDDSNVISANSIMAPSGEELELLPTTIEETRAFYELLYNNLDLEVEKVNTVNCKTRETNEKLTAKLARY